MRAAILFAAFVLGFVTDALGQDAVTLTPGTRVRVTAPAHFTGRTEGTVQAGAVIRIAGQVPDPLLIPIADVVRLERFGGRKSGWLMGAMVGGVLGAIGGAAATAAANEGLSTMILVDPATGAALGFVVGGVVGAGIGALIRHDTWKVVRLEQVRVAVGPLGRGFGLGASIAF